MCVCFSNSNGSGGARRQLLQAERSGRLRVWLDSLDRRRSNLSARLQSSEDKLLLAAITEEIHDVRHAVAGVSLM